VGDLNDISFVAYSSTARQVSFKSALTGWDIGHVLVDEGVSENADLDNDGFEDDDTALYCGGPIRTLRSFDDILGDVVVRGADRAGFAMRRFTLRGGDLFGDVTTLDGGIKSMTIKAGYLFGDMRISGDLRSLVVREGRGSGMRGGDIDGGHIVVNGTLRRLSARAVVNHSLIAASNIHRITIRRDLSLSHIHAGGTFALDGDWTAGHGNIRRVSIGNSMISSNITAGAWLGDNWLWDTYTSEGDPNVDDVCEADGTSVIWNVVVKGHVISPARHGIFAATDIKHVRVRGDRLHVRSDDLPYPNADYDDNTTFLIDVEGNWFLT